MTLLVVRDSPSTIVADERWPRDADRDQDALIFIKAIFAPFDLIEFRAIQRDGRAPSQRWAPAADAAHLIPWLHEVNSDGADIYMGANPRRRRGGTSRDVAVARALVVDFDDGADVGLTYHRIREAILPDPSIVVRSGHGVHAWWLLDESLEDLDAWSGHQKALIHALGSDPRVHDPPRIMRLPGFVNHKPPAARAEIVFCDPDARYCLSEFPELPATPCKKSKEMRTKDKTHLVNNCGASTPKNEIVVPADVLSAQIAGDEVARATLRTLVENTLPYRPGMRRKRLFDLACRLLGYFPDTCPADWTAFVIWWHRLPQAHHSKSHSPEESVRDFEDAWRDVKHPVLARLRRLAGDSLDLQLPEWIVRACRKDELLLRLARLCRRLWQHHRMKPFPLCVVPIGTVLGCGRQQAGRKIKRLCAHGVIRCVAEYTRGRCRMYEWTGDSA